jgi:hypothetical protein
MIGKMVYSTNISTHINLYITAAHLFSMDLIKRGLSGTHHPLYNAYKPQKGQLSPVRLKIVSFTHVAHRSLYLSM